VVSRQWPEEIANHLALNAIHRLSDQSVGHVKPLFLWLARPEVLDEIVEHSVETVGIVDEEGVASIGE